MVNDPKVSHKYLMRHYAQRHHKHIHHTCTNTYRAQRSSYTKRSKLPTKNLINANPLTNLRVTDSITKMVLHNQKHHTHRHHMHKYLMRHYTQRHHKHIHHTYREHNVHRTQKDLNFQQKNLITPIPLTNLRITDSLTKMISYNQRCITQRHRMHYYLRRHYAQRHHKHIHHTCTHIRRATFIVHK
jgi:hypothetical protein